VNDIGDFLYIDSSLDINTGAVFTIATRVVRERGVARNNPVPYEKRPAAAFSLCSVVLLGRTGKRRFSTAAFPI